MSQPTHILLAEDDANIREGLVDTLESEGYRVTAAADGNEALDRFGKGRFDLLILDIMMPGRNGYDVCREVRAHNDSIPIIMLTAKGEEVDKVVGLELGADDYVTKPFGVRELLARIAAILRRLRRGCGAKAEAAPAPEPFAFGQAQIDPKQYRARVGRKTVDLSARELHLLKLFHEHPKEVLGRDRLLNEVWGIDYFGTTRTLDQHIAQLRKKVEADPDEPRYIRTVHGVGYRYEP